MSEYPLFAGARPLRCNAWPYLVYSLAQRGITRHMSLLIFICTICTYGVLFLFCFDFRLLSGVFVKKLVVIIQTLFFSFCHWYYLSQPGYNQDFQFKLPIGRINISHTATVSLEGWGGGGVMCIYIIIRAAERGGRGGATCLGPQASMGPQHEKCPKIEQRPITIGASTRH